MAKKKNKKAKYRNGTGRAVAGANPNANGGLLSGLGGLLPSGRTEQFLLGALIGAAGAYVLADEEIRGKLIRAGLKLYSGLAGGIEEVKEQVADLKAELEAEQSGAL